MMLFSLLLGVAMSVEASEKNKNHSVVAFGDSITRGYGVPDGSGWVELLPELLKKKSKKQISVFNAGGNGNTSSEGFKRIKEVLLRMPGLVLVEFGGNDSVHSSRNVSVDDFEKNILKITKQVRAKKGKIILITFPPVIDDWHAWRKDPYFIKKGGLDKCVEQYRQRTRVLAKRLKCPLFDLDRFLRMQIKKEGKEKIISKDGIHLTVEGNKLVAKAVLPYIIDNIK